MKVFLPLGIAFISFLVSSCGIAPVTQNKVASPVLTPIPGQFNNPVTVTAACMTIGAVLMLSTGLATQGMPKFSLASWGAILWMAVVNTAFAFTLWNYTQRSLLAMETTIINNTMTVQIAILGWIFSGESLTALEIGGVILVSLGAVLVQLRRLRQINPQIGT